MAEPRRSPRLVVARGREKSILRRHPWVFSGAVERVEGDPRPGDTVDIVDGRGRFLARGAFSPSSQLRARVWTFDEDEPVDEAFIAARVLAAAARRDWLRDRSDGLRLVFAESDGLPGVIVDRYGPVAVCEPTSTGADRWRHVIADALMQIDGIESVMERADAPVRAKEGLMSRTGLLTGKAPPPFVAITERFAGGGSITLGVDVAEGHKTGCYLDQRENRAIVASVCADRRVLDVCSYTGGFSVAASAGGARSVTLVDSSGPALSTAAGNLERNGIRGAEVIEADAFTELRRLRESGRGFDVVVLDPPKLAGSARHVDRASRAYKDLNLNALKLIEPGGWLATFSCSGAISEDLFSKIVFGAALDAGRDVQVVQYLSQAADHPVLLTFPEARYLKGLLCRVE
ncbi:MAG: class I SAM-dependent rRNA methyltransferase [Acidimicrobiia bacterium]